MTLLSLRTGRLAVDLAPSAGGAIARFAVGDRDVLRPMAEADRRSGRETAARLSAGAILQPHQGRSAHFRDKTFHLSGTGPA